MSETLETMKKMFPGREGEKALGEDHYHLPMLRSVLRKLFWFHFYAMEQAYYSKKATQLEWELRVSSLDTAESGLLQNNKHIFLLHHSGNYKTGAQREL